MTDLDEKWLEVESYLQDAKSMHWDGCHKIYLAMDDEEMAEFIKYGYDVHEPNLELLQDWFDQSCFLRFVDAVYTDHQDPNAGFYSLIPQFAFEEDEEEYD